MIVEGARGPLNAFIPDVFIYTDTYKGADAGKYGCSIGCNSMSVLDDCFLFAQVARQRCVFGC